MAGARYILIDRGLYAVRVALCSFHFLLGQTTKRAYIHCACLLSVPTCAHMLYLGSVALPTQRNVHLKMTFTAKHFPTVYTAWLCGDMNIFLPGQLSLLGRHLYVNSMQLVVHPFWLIIASVTCIVFQGLQLYFSCECTFFTISQ